MNPGTYWYTSACAGGGAYVPVTHVLFTNDSCPSSPLVDAHCDSVTFSRVAPPLWHVVPACTLSRYCVGDTHVTPTDAFDAMPGRHPVG